MDDLLRALEGELSSRRFGDAVRLEVANDCPDELDSFPGCAVSARRAMICITAMGPVNLMRLATIPDLVERPEFKFPGFTP